MSAFDDSFVALMGSEGKYWDDPVGGATMFGVTEKVARAFGYKGEMRVLPIETAKAIAKRDYWDPYKLDQLPPAIAFQVFDTAYNGGYPVKWLQEAVGAKADGVVGAQTIAAARAADPRAVVIYMNAKRLLYMTELKNWPDNSRGWARRIVSNLLKGL